MGIVTLPSFGSDPATVNAAALDGKVDPLATEFNGNIDNNNIKAAAGIVYSKLTLTGNIVNADISATAAIVDTKLAAISTAGKVNFSALVVGSQATGDIAYASSATVWTRLAAGTTSQILIGGASAPSWSTVPLAAMPSGSVIQTVSTLITTPVDVTSVYNEDDTNPLYSEGQVLGSLAITPNNASNTLSIEMSGWGSVSGSSHVLFWINDATGSDEALAVRRGFNSTNEGVLFSISLPGLSAGSTSARTYYLMAAVSANTFYFGRKGNGSDLFGSAAFGSIKIQEIKA